MNYNCVKQHIRSNALSNYLRTSRQIHLRYTHASPVVHESLCHKQMEYLLAS